MGAYFTKKAMTIDGKSYDVNVWDTAGEEKFHSLTKIYTRGAHCAIVMYDITLHSSWKAVNTWLSELDDDCVIIIAGNKRMQYVLFLFDFCYVCVCLFVLDENSGFSAEKTQRTRNQF